MVLTPRLEQRQLQSLVMTPQLQQAIKLLQMSNLELGEFVENELRDNPILERDEGQNQEIDLPNDGDDGKAAVDKTESDQQGVDYDSSASFEIPTEKGLDAELDNIYTNDSLADIGGGQNSSGADGQPNVPENALSTASFSGSKSGGRGFDGPGVGLEQTVAETPTLRAHLTRQLALGLNDATDRMIALFLIDQLDGAGYYNEDLQAVADQLGCSLGQVEGVFYNLQQFDPPGIFARSLSECLALQLIDRDRYDPAMEIFVENLDMLANRNLSGLAEICGVDGDDIAQMIIEIKELNPKPAMAFDHEVIRTVTPDIFMRALPDQSWHIELNTENLPKVLVNNQYQAAVNKVAQSKEDKRYIQDQLQSASWLVKSLHQRATTILKVATELVRQQDTFFKRGIRYLKPLVLRDIADAIEMHESTVSRVTTNKYMATPRGIFELKYFFTSSINATNGGDTLSAEAVKYQIKELIDGEDAKKILSDDKIVGILKTAGVDIARRTVAKYREALGLGSSVTRRREKAEPT